jgi:ATP-dependent DNA helicase RecG
MFDVSVAVGRLRVLGSDCADVEAKRASGGVPANLSATLSAFANMPGGGTILLGVNESSGFTPVAIDAAALRSAIAAMARTAVEPPLQVEFDVAPFEGFDVLAVTVQELPESAKPCVVRRTGRGYLRSWDGDFELSDLEVQAFVSNRTRPRHDEDVVDGATFADLSTQLVGEYLETARATDTKLGRISDDTSLLTRTGVIGTSGTPTVAGLLALGEYPQQWFPNFVIQAAAAPLPGSPPEVRIGDTARFSGAIPEMIDDALSWVARHSAHRIVDGPDGRVRDQYDFPAVAVRELLSNALVHRDLSGWAWSRAIELRTTTDALRLVNPGGLYGVTVSRLFENQLTSARNAALCRICQFVRLRDGRVVEALGTGMQKILDSTVGAGLPTPRFFDQGITFTAILDRPFPFGGVPVPQQSPRIGNAATESAPQSTTPQRITPAQQRVLDMLGSDSLSQAELSARLGLSAPATLHHLRKLVAAGRVVSTGGRGQRDTRYRASPHRGTATQASNAATSEPSS